MFQPLYFRSFQITAAIADSPPYEVYVFAPPVTRFQFPADDDRSPRRYTSHTYSQD